LGDRKLIGAQGPTSVTVYDFWRMIVQENVTLVVSTCNLIEDGRSKCEKFWPSDCTELKHLKDTGIKVSLNGSEQLSPTLTLRTFIVDDPATGT